MSKLIEYTEDQTRSTTLNLDADGLLRGAGSKQVLISSSANPIVSVGSNVSGNLHQNAVIENIVLQGVNGTETAILLEDVYNCLIRNVAIKNADVGIKLTATTGKYTEATRIEHVRMAWVNKGIQFVQGTGTGNFGFTHIDDVGISLKDAQDLEGIGVGPGCKLHAPFIKANVWSSQKCDGMYVNGEIKAGIVNINHEKPIGHVEGHGINSGSLAVVNDNQHFDHNRCFVTTGHISSAIYNPYSKTHDIDYKTYATTGYWVSGIVTTETYGAGAVYNPNGLIGNTNSGSYANLCGPNNGDGGAIVGYMNDEAHGKIHLYGYSAPEYQTHLYVYVSYDYQNWTLTKVQTVNPDPPHWIDCGSHSSNFRYIAIAAIDDEGYSANIHIDSACVTP